MRRAETGSAEWPAVKAWTDRAAAAAELARRGFHVFPCHWIMPGGGCSCGNPQCGSAGKHPKTRSGVLEATRDERTIREWWDRWPDANPAVRCDPETGLFVFDGDNAAAVEWLAGFGLTPTVRTARGSHYYATYPAGRSYGSTKGKLAPGVDTRAGNGYVLAPPSNHITGVIYEWVDGEPPSTLQHVPAALLALLDNLNRQAGPAAPMAPYVPPANDKELALMVKRARSYLSNTPPAIQGQGGDAHTLVVACRLARDFALPDDAAMALFQEWNARCEPPWSDEDLAKKLQNARSYGTGPIGSLAVRPYYPGAAPDANGNGHGANGSTVPNPEGSADAPPDWPEIIPISEFNLPAFPTDALPDWLRAYVEAEAEAMQVPTDLPGVLTLAVLATCCAKRAVVTEWLEPLNLYTVVALPPGERKSPVFAHVCRPIESWERRKNAELAPEVAAKEAEYDLLKKTLEKKKLKAAGAHGGTDETKEEIRSLAEEIARAVLPKPIRTIVDDVTPERLVTMMVEQDGRIACLSCEGDAFDIISGRYSEEDGIRGVYLKGHSADTLRVDRVIRVGGRPAENLHRPALTFGLAVQPAVLQGLMFKPGFHGRGLLGRFLYAIPTSNVGYRNTNPAPVPGAVQSNYHRHITALLNIPAPAASPSAGEGANTEPILELDTEARRLFQAFKDKTEEALRPGGALSLMPDWGGKICGEILRLAGLLHIADRCTLPPVVDGAPAPEPMVTEPITESAMTGAIQLGEYFTEHAMAAYSLMGGAAATESARLILRWIVDAKLESFSKRDAHSRFRSQFQQSSALDGPLSILCERGYIRKLEKPDSGGAGRPAGPVFQVSPLCTKYTKYTKPTAGSNFVDFVNFVHSDLGEGSGTAAGEWEE